MEIAALENKTYYNWQDVHDACVSIALKLYRDNWRPDYIVGLNRGGLPLSVMMSHAIGCNHHTLDVRLRDGGDMSCESNLWMAEDAFGYVSLEEQETYKSRWDIARRKNILIVDDINDTGATFEWIKKDWESGCLPGEDHGWSTVWNNNVRFAVMCEKSHTNFADVDYVWQSIDTGDSDTWLVFPWENFK